MAKFDLENVKDINELDARHDEWLKANQAQEREFNKCRQQLIRAEQDARRRNEEFFVKALPNMLKKKTVSL